MKKRELKLTMPDGTTDAVLYTVDDSRPQPGVLLIPDIGGPRDVISQMAERIVNEGHTVLIPNPFYRTSKPPVFKFPRKPGDNATRQRMGELLGPLTPDAIDADAAAYIDFLTSQPTTKPGGIGVVGFCIGGLLAFRAAASRPDKAAVAVSFHGGGLYKANDPKSAHLGLPKIKARLYFGHAVEDNSMNAEAIAELEKALQAWRGRYESEVYEGAHHGWTMPDNSAYNQRQAERALAKLMSVFKENLIENT
ncbi:dienelactone hydrolase family protein [Alloacidobacterium sp.]|uniref:dienelactone hydrolase family protein n=1 Tax=Alloacidobacterium sp. TaxID=2951999 RepID=UPI002D30EB34|nr:dienelactone hydrolase family protein [Alloacidobacterium sp.]HYK36947.1 dienelactone hydrolase family protein [Alloacidobacterium sp.]